MTVLLGRTSAGSGTSDFNGSQHSALWKFTASAGGRAALFVGNTQQANATGTVSVGAYNDNAGVVGTFINRINAGAGANGATQWSVDISSWAWDVTNGSVYWIGWRNSAENYDFKGDTSAGIYQENNGTVDFPNPYGAASAGNTTAIMWIEDSGGATVAWIGDAG